MHQCEVDINTSNTVTLSRSSSQTTLAPSSGGLPSDVFVFRVNIFGRGPGCFSHILMTLTDIIFVFYRITMLSPPLLIPCFEQFEAP